jgi:hypothetical protein
LIFGVAQALNFFAFGTFSPLRCLSAPKFCPLLGHPYLGEQDRKKDTKTVIKAAFIKLLFII